MKNLVIIILVTTIWCQTSLGQSNRQLVRPTATSSDKRLALVIGNGAYRKARTLVNPANDAVDIGSTLSGLGFDVISGTNLTLKQMNDKVREFGDKLKVNGGVGLFYYAGHGIQVGGRNYLIPVEADIPREDEVDFSALNLDVVLRKMATANNGLNIVVLDACRNNPFARSWSRGDDEGGLAQITAPTGTFIAYATSPDRTASDGTGRNGLYTGQLLKYIRQPGLKIEEAFKQVTIGVDRASNGKQIPWTSSSLRGEFYFAAVTRDGEDLAWESVKNTSDPGQLRLYLAWYPEGAHANEARNRIDDLTWASAKTSNDHARIEKYLADFPNGRNAAAARIIVRQVEARKDARNSDLAKVGVLSTGTVRKNSIGMELVWIPPGEFMMGSSEDDISESLYMAQKDRREATRSEFDIEKPQHRVRISEGFWMGKYEVTQAQWRALMDNNPSDFKNCDKCPVETVSWDDAKAFLRKLNQKADGFVYRLPTEAEWEYAARAETTSPYGGTGNLDDMGWYPNNSGRKTHPVGGKLGNGFGLYDMHGNVWEWCEDYYGLYRSGEVTDPKGSTNGEGRVLRGGAWSYVATAARSASRFGQAPSFRYGFIGFRVVARAK